MKKNNKGFSLVELIVVIAIMAILAAVAIPTFATFINKANEGADEDFMNQAAYAIELANAGTFEFDLTSVSVVVDDDGDITSISYVVGSENPVDIPKEPADNADQKIKDASGAIDWEYKFKAY